MKIINAFLLSITIFLMLSSCEVQNKPRSSPFSEFSVTGSEVWIIDGKEYRIIETAIIIDPSEGPFLVVKVWVDSSVGPENEGEAKSIAIYAVDNGYLKQANDADLRKDGKPIEISEDIGVSLIYEKQKGIISKRSGYNFKFTEEEINRP
jgi:hypothetical protein